MLLLKSLNQSIHRGDEIQKHNNEYQRLTMNVLRLTFLSSFVLEFIATLSTAVIAVEIGLRLLSGKMDFVSAMFVLLLAPEFYLPLRQLGMKFHAGMSGRSASKKIFEVLAENELAVPSTLSISIKSKEEMLPLHADPFEKYFPVKFENVSAVYPGMETPVLRGINLQIERNEKVALVGRSGMGKTSLTFILMRLLAFTEGSVCFGGNVLNEMSELVLTSLISWVPQNPYIFPGSISENISLFEDNPDYKKIIRIISQVSIK